MPKLNHVLHKILEMLFFSYKHYFIDLTLVFNQIYYECNFATYQKQLIIMVLVNHISTQKIKTDPIANLNIKTYLTTI